MNDELNVTADTTLDLNLSDLSLDDVEIVSEDDSYALAEAGASFSPLASCTITIKTK